MVTPQRVRTPNSEYIELQMNPSRESGATSGETLRINPDQASRRCFDRFEHLLVLPRQREILLAAEDWDDELFDAGWESVEQDLALPLAAVAAQRAADADAIVVVDAANGDLARRVAQCAPDVPVVALCASRRVARQLSLSRGVFPTFVEDAPASVSYTHLRAHET